MKGLPGGGTSVHATTTGVAGFAEGTVGTEAVGEAPGLGNGVTGVAGVATNGEFALVCAGTEGWGVDECGLLTGVGTEDDGCVDEGDRETGLGGKDVGLGGGGEATGLGGGVEETGLGGGGEAEGLGGEGEETGTGRGGEATGLGEDEACGVDGNGTLGLGDDTDTWGEAGWVREGADGVDEGPPGVGGAVVAPGLLADVPAGLLGVGADVGPAVSRPGLTSVRGAEGVAAGLPGKATGAVGAGLPAVGLPAGPPGEATGAVGTGLPAGVAGVLAGVADGTTGSDGVVLPFAVDAGVVVGVGAGNTGDDAGDIEVTGDAGITVLNGGAKPGHLPQVICKCKVSIFQHRQDKGDQLNHIFKRLCTYLTVPKWQSWCGMCDEGGVAFAICFLQRIFKSSSGGERSARSECRSAVSPNVAWCCYIPALHNCKD